MAKKQQKYAEMIKEKRRNQTKPPVRMFYEWYDLQSIISGSIEKANPYTIALFINNDTLNRKSINFWR
jgi:hypothetical protein